LVDEDTSSSDDNVKMTEELLNNKPYIIKLAS